MRTLVHSLLTTSVVALAICSGYAQEPSFEVKISSPTTEFTVASSVRVDVTLANRSQQLLVFRDPRCNPEGITVRDDRQLALKLRAWFRQDGWISCDNYFVEASRSVTLQVNMAKWFDLSRPGCYFVQIAPTGVSRDNKRETRKSNVLEIQIVQVK